MLAQLDPDEGERARATRDQREPRLRDARHRGDVRDVDERRERAALHERARDVGRQVRVELRERRRVDVAEDARALRRKKSTSPVVSAEVDVAIVLSSAGACSAAHPTPNTRPGINAQRRMSCFMGFSLRGVDHNAPRRSSCLRPAARFQLTIYGRSR